MERYKSKFNEETIKMSEARLKVVETWANAMMKKFQGDIHLAKNNGKDEVLAQYMGELVADAVTEATHNYAIRKFGEDYDDAMEFCVAFGAEFINGMERAWFNPIR